LVYSFATTLSALTTWALLAEIARRGGAILLVEQKLTIALDVSRSVYVMGHGRVVFQGTPTDFLPNDLEPAAICRSQCFVQ
jgi:ABC-type branched-subunit amino acid transport system ATPase component